MQFSVAIFEIQGWRHDENFFHKPMGDGHFMFHILVHADLVNRSFIWFRRLKAAGVGILTPDIYFAYSAAVDCL